MEIEFEIPQGYYTKQELENYIQDNILKIVNTPINGYSSTERNITISLKNIICGMGNHTNQKELKRRFEEEKELKRRCEEEIRERIKI